MATEGGAQQGGTFFQLTPAGDFEVIEAFTAAPTASPIPSTGLLQARDGSIYGAASRGGADGKGALFRWTPDGTFVILYSFDGGAAGTQPATLIQASDGNFYGATFRGGAHNAGTIFRMTPDGTVTVLYDQNGGGTSHGFIEADDGNLYVTNGDDVLRLTPDGMISVLYTFRVFPKSLLQASDGQLYGTTSFGDGTLFRLTLDGTVTTLHTFSYPDAWDVLGVPIQRRDGYLYGTTLSGGGPGKQGIVFRLRLE